jgi:16S rRNA (cytosine967-C5)-methyltransferase
MNRPPRRHQAKPTLTPLAELTAAVAPAVVHSVVRERQRLAPALADALKDRGPTTGKDRFWIARSVSALLRWWGWIEPLHLPRIEEQLLLASVLDSSEVSAMARVWAARIGRHPETLSPVGDAPNWTARALGLKRFLGGRPVNADPWRLFPLWLRDQLPVPPGDQTPKVRRLDFLAVLQSRPSVWVAVRGEDPKAIWSELREAELKPWVHRRIPTAAKLPADSDLTAFESFRTGRLVQEDLASQAVAIVCDPDPGERWWDVNGENGLHALHLAALMKGKGLVVATFDNKRKQQAAALRLRPGAFHNITTRTWDARHPPGKHASYDGVLLDAPCSGIGSWRRHPDARWTISADQISALVAHQLQSLDIASSAVRPGGTLVYTVVTATRKETVDVIAAFLESHREFRLDPSPHPLEDAPPTAKLQLWPHVHDSDARFIARLVREPAKSPAPETLDLAGRA